jgi:hypothetical protein
MTDWSRWACCPRTMMSNPLSRVEVAALADDLRGMLATIESGEIEATTTMRHRIEGALARHRPPRPRPARWSPTSSGLARI